MINAIRYTEKLEEAGFTPEQAKNSVKYRRNLGTIISQQNLMLKN